MENSSEQIDTRVISARPEVWSRTELVAKKFDHLPRSKSGLYNVAVGLNAMGEEVNVKLIGPYRQPKEDKKSIHRRVMQIKANKKFDLPEDAKSPASE